MLRQILNRLVDTSALVDAELADYSETYSSDEQFKESTYKLSVIIPVFNEEKTIGLVISRVAALPLNTEIVIVDDCSTDGTRAVLSKLTDVPGLKIILKNENQGKGAALRTGLEHVTGDYIIVQDADLEYNPRDIPGILQPLLRDEADVVYGSRFIGEDQQDESWIHRMGNAVLTGASNLLSGLRLTDMETCYKAFSKKVLRDLTIEQNRFGIEPEVTAKLARRGYRFAEVPISYESRGYDEGKKIGIRDLFNAIYCIGRYGVSD
jgi:glycosyltransferase involved in cell wall biosynthesis